MTRKSRFPKTDKRGTNPNSKANLRLFSTENQPERRGRPKGSKDRKYLVRKWLEVMVELEDPLLGKGQKGLVSDAIVIATIQKALSGDVKAAELLLDSAFGKLTQSHEVTAFNPDHYSDDELRAIAEGAPVEPKDVMDEG